MTSSFFKKFRFQNVFLFTMKRKAGVVKFLWLKERFSFAKARDGLVWTVSSTVEIKLRFHDGLVWTVGPTVDIKLRF